MTGTWINVAAVLAGSLVGLALRRTLPERVAGTVLQGVGLAVLLIGAQMSLETGNVLLPLFSLALGAAVGEALDLEAALERLGEGLQRRVARLDPGGRFTEAFVTPTLLFLVGPMAIMGAINDGLLGDSSLLVTKSLLDGITALALASTLGVGVVFSAIPVLLYQGAIALAAGTARALFTDPVVREMTATGGLLVIGIGINMLRLGSMRVGNLLPALAVVLVLARLVGR
ncbi:DUF554 domain-containing protein [Limnochorda pilosa]|uniref:Membrane protein n=1 Tax=Limnochorda pilosa TaxID=1555112 RepID=A0A0K2SG15_LIMPI|nr:DUF554 domain-containing protein [Limnochorda pilosa]BAS26035.1 membrane protein [Limnochorda pilosa]